MFSRKVLCWFSLLLSCQPSMAGTVSYFPLLGRNPAKDMISPEQGAGILAEKENLSDSIEKVCLFHLKRALYLKAHGKGSAAEEELKLAQSRYRTDGRESNLSALAYLAASYDACGNDREGRSLYDELAQRFKELSSKSAHTTKGKNDYPTAMMELAAYSTVELNSYSVAESLAQELCHQLEIGGAGDGTLAGQALTFIGALQLKSGDGKTALATLERARDICDKDKGSETSRKAELELSRALIQQSKWSDAIKLLQQMIADESKSEKKSAGFVQAIGLLYRAYYKTGKSKDAEALCQTWVKELHNSSSIYIPLLRELSDAAMKRNDYMRSAELTNEAESLQSRIGALKTAVNDMIGHYYVLKSCGFFAQAETTLKLENDLRRLEDVSAPDRVPIRGPQDGSSDADASSLTDKQRNELALSKTKVAGSLAGYRKILLKEPELSDKLKELDTLVSSAAPAINP